MKQRSQTVIAYSRVSTEEQANSGLGLADQKAVIASEAMRRRWDDVVYLSDDGYSAKNLSRPAIAEALELLGSGQASTLVVSKLDRLAVAARLRQPDADCQEAGLGIGSSGHGCRHHHAQRSVDGFCDGFVC